MRRTTWKNKRNTFDNVTIADIPTAAISRTQMLDLYIPTGSGPFSVVMNIHPGKFFSGQKDMVPGTTGKAFLAAGYAIASINYLPGEVS